MDTHEPTYQQAEEVGECQVEEVEIGRSVHELVSQDDEHGARITKDAGREEDAVGQGDRGHYSRGRVLRAKEAFEERGPRVDRGHRDVAERQAGQGRVGLAFVAADEVGAHRGRRLLLLLGLGGEHHGCLGENGRFPMSGRTNTRSIPQKISAVVGIHLLARFFWVD